MGCMNVYVDAYGLSSSKEQVMYDFDILLCSVGSVHAAQTYMDI